jgi:AraC-like DNA-binding protein
VAEPSVGAGFARGLLEFAVSRGADAAALAAAARLDPALLADQDNRVPFARYVALMRAAQALTGDPALALHYGEAVDIRELSIVGLMGQACATVMDAFAQGNAYGRLDVDFGMGAADRLQLVHRDGGLWVVDARPNPNDFPEITESAFARMACSMARLGIGGPPEAVHVTHKAPPWRAEYDRIFGTRVVFEAGWNAMRIDAAHLALPVAMQPPYMRDVLAARADALLERLDRETTLRGQVEALLAELLPGGGARVDVAAARLGISRQTLYRRLRAEGTTFARLLDALRHRLALEQLRDRKASVGEIAYRLGYSDRAAFAHAFKRWTGRSPGAA